MTLAQFIQKIARQQGYTTCDGPIDITIQYDRIRYRADTHRLFLGSVYGFAVNLDEVEKKSLFEEAQGLRQTNLASIDEWRPIYNENVYPLYWGKEWESGSRLYAHLGGHKGNNSLCLYEQNYAQLQGRNLLYASVRVSSHEQLEEHLLCRHRPLMKTVKGKGPKE